MSRMRVLLARITGLFGQRRRERDLEDELRFHLEREVERYTAQGMSPEEALDTARKRFGGLDRTKERYRDAHGIPWIETLGRDLQYGVRMLRGNPGFTIAAVLSLGLGIGVNCAVFTLTNAALLRDLPVKDPDRLALISARSKGRGDFSYPIFREIAERQRSFETIAASGGASFDHVVFRGADLQDAGELDGAVVSGNYFEMMGVGARIGRVFTPSDGAGQFAVLGFGFWRSKLGADTSVLGESLVLDGAPFTIIGIAAESFGSDRIASARDFWVPITTQPRQLLDSRTTSFFRTIGRLKPGVSAEQAAAETTGLYRQSIAAEDQSGTGTRINRDNPADARVEVTAGTTGLNPIRARTRKPILLLSGVVGVVLLIACANVANLLLARSAAREHEIGVRLAVGSSRGRLVRQFLTESLLLAVAGGLLGFGAAQWGSQLLLGTAEGILPAGLDLSPGWRVFAFVCGVSLLTVLIFGLLPALQASRAGAPLQGIRAAAGGRVRNRTSRVLVLAQAGLSLWLLIGAGLLLQSLRNLRTAEVGVDRSHLAVFNLSPEGSADATAAMREVEQRLAALPGVRSTARSMYGLFGEGAVTAPARVPGSTADGSRQIRAGWVSPGFFRTLGIDLALGRDFTEQDLASAPMAGILSESAAHYYFGDRNPVGEAIYLPGLDARNRYIPFSKDLAEARRIEIVGVARDARDRGPRQPPTHGVYLPAGQRAGFAGTLYVRTEGDPDVLTAGILQVLREYSGQLRVRDSGTVDEILDGGLQTERLLARLLGFFGVLALTLAGVGLYGVMAYAVTRRTSEIGLRMALGAARGSVLTMVLRETLALVVTGAALGVLTALATTHLLESVLFGLTPNDPGTIVAVTAVLLGVAVLAGYVPARRAARVDPLVALRHD